MLIETYGDLVTDVSYDIFCHQTNCKGVMGAGLARQIKEAYPEVYAENVAYCELNKADNGKSMLGSNLYVKTSDGRSCVNMYAQLAYGTDRQQTDYDAFQSCLDHLARKLFLSDASLKVAFPYKIGCGLGGGKWSIIHGKLKQLSRLVKQDIYIVRKA